MYPNDAVYYQRQNHHRTTAKKYEDTGSQVFRKYVLSWRIEDIARRNQSLRELPKALEKHDISHYYQNFLPLILEETRAILAHGLDAERENKTQPFDVTVVSLETVWGNFDKPANLELKGRLPKNTDEGVAWIALKLTYYGDGNRGTSILCLADIKENNIILAKVGNSVAFQAGSKLTACVLGSVLSQMRMFEACYAAPKPIFIQDVITGQLQTPIRKVIRQFPEFNISQQQAVQAFSALLSKDQQPIINFFFVDFTSQKLILKFFSLHTSRQQMVKHFLSLHNSEQIFVRDFYLLNVVEQKSVNTFSALNFTRQQVIQSFASLGSSERESIYTFDTWPTPNQKAIQYFSSLSGLEQDSVNTFSLLADLEWEAVNAFYLLNPSEQETIKEFYNLHNELQEVIQNSSSFLASAWKFITGRSWYEKEINRLQELLTDKRASFNISQQHAVELFYQMSPSRQELIYSYFLPNFLYKKTIREFLNLDVFQRQAVKIFYSFNPGNQIAIKKFYELDSSAQDDIRAFYRLSAAEQQAINYLYALHESQQATVQTFSRLGYLKQGEIKDFYVLDYTILETICPFTALSPSIQASIRHFSLFDAQARHAMHSFSLLTISEKAIYNEFYTLNYSQRAAVRDFYGLTQGIQLLQGPPGTGKTTTIVTFLNFLCAQNKRILVCAPSNKAVQVIAERFFEKYPVHKSLLIGVEDKLKPSLRPIFIHTWANDICSVIDQHIRKINSCIQKNKAMRYTRLSQPIQQIITTIQHATQLFSNSLYRLEQTLTLASFHAISLQEIATQLSNLKLEICSANKYNPKQFGSELELELLNYAQVIFATLSTSGRRIFENIIRPDILIIDEASQAVEAETLIPFALQPDKCLLVGDTKQLPATVISKEAVQYNYHWSMMWRLIEECGQRCGMLIIQHRMHPAIRQWPSQQYYNNQLKDAPAIAERPASVSQHGAYAFIDIASDEQFSGYSFYNPRECRQVMMLLYELASKNIDIRTQVGIITFYAAQVDYMQQEFNKLPWLKDVKVHTVDSYQGNESDYIIISFVRSNRGGGIGFLHDFRRLNVAITRARLALLMVGNAATLERYRQQDVAELVKDARARGCLFGKDVPKQPPAQKQTRSSMRFFKEKAERKFQDPQIRVQPISPLQADQHLKKYKLPLQNSTYSYTMQ